MIRFTELRATQRGQKPEEAPIHYIGISYGIVIGQTLAALYPDRIGRIILDSNFDGEGHYSGNTSTAVQDADDTLRTFFEMCIKAGKNSCPFAENSKSAQDLDERFNALLQSLEKEPLQAIDPAFDNPLIVTKDRVLEHVFSLLYIPDAWIDYIGIELAVLSKGDGTTWVKLVQGASPKNMGGPYDWTSTTFREVDHLVTNIDAAGRYPYKNVEEYMAAMDKLEKSSAWFGGYYDSSSLLVNAGSTITPPQSQLFPGFTKTKTRNPILFLNNVADPVTPLSSARHMATFFEGSAVLAQSSAGHGVISKPWKCTVKCMVQYLIYDKLPANGTVC